MTTRANNRTLGLSVIQEKFKWIKEGEEKERPVLLALSRTARRRYARNMKEYIKARAQYFATLGKPDPRAIDIASGLDANIRETICTSFEYEDLQYRPLHFMYCCQAFFTSVRLVVSTTSSSLQDPYVPAGASLLAKRREASETFRAIREKSLAISVRLSPSRTFKDKSRNIADGVQASPPPSASLVSRAVFYAPWAANIQRRRVRS